MQLNHRKSSKDASVNVTSLNHGESDIAVGTVFLDGAEAHLAANGNLIDDGLQRGLQGRHLQMIAFGGVVGYDVIEPLQMYIADERISASIWYGTGYAIAYAGPVGALICFIVIGVDVFFVMQSLGEMGTLLPLPGAFNEVDCSLRLAIERSVTLTTDVHALR